MGRGLDRQSQVLERETEIKTGDGGDGDGKEPRWPRCRKIKQLEVAQERTARSPRTATKITLGH